MAENPIPDPRAVEALGEAVNDIYRGLALPGIPDLELARQGVETMTDASPRAQEAYMTIWDFVSAGRAGPYGPVVSINAEEAGEVLMLAVGAAFAHQAAEHPEAGWVGCQPYTEVVCHAARVFLSAVGYARPT